MDEISNYEILELEDGTLKYIAEYRGLVKLSIRPEKVEGNGGLKKSIAKQLRRLAYAIENYDWKPEFKMGKDLGMIEFSIMPVVEKRSEIDG